MPQDADPTPTPPAPPAAAPDPPAPPAPAPVPAPAPAGPAPAAPQPAAAFGPKEVADLYERLLTKKAGDAEGLARELVRINLELKDQGATLQAENARLKDSLGRAVPDGSVVVSKADADALAAYRGLGTREELTASLDRLTRAEQEAAAAAHEETLRRVCDASEYFGPRYDMDVLRGLSAGVEFVPGKVRARDGKMVDTLRVRDQDENGKERTRTLDEVEQAEWSKYQLALRPGLVKPGAGGPRPRGGTGYRGSDAYRAEPTAPAADRGADRARTAQDENERVSIALGASL